MRNIIVILMIIFIQTPVFGYKVVRKQIPPAYNAPNYYWHNPWNYGNYNYPPSYSYTSTPMYQSYTPLRKIKSYFIGAPTGYTMTPYYNTNSNTQNERNFFSDNGGDEYYYDNGSYYKQNREITGGGSVSIIND